MTEREQKVTILNRMLENGYHLGQYTFDEYIDMCTLAQWERAEKRFMEWKNEQ